MKRKMLMCFFGLMMNPFIKSMEKMRVVEGDLCLVGGVLEEVQKQSFCNGQYGCIYNWSICDQSGEIVPIEPGTLCVCVIGSDPYEPSRDQEQNYWIHHKMLGKMPRLLPYEMVKNKTEGSILELYKKNMDTNEVLKVRFTCRHNYGINGREFFEDWLKEIASRTRSQDNGQCCNY